eukprot:scaffold104673_cov57-Phaeocystis_antarctica.AAC.2
MGASASRAALREEVVDPKPVTVAKLLVPIVGLLRAHRRELKHSAVASAHGSPLGRQCAHSGGPLSFPLGVGGRRRAGLGRTGRARGAGLAPRGPTLIAAHRTD